LQPSLGGGRTYKPDARRKTGTTRAHELGLRCYLDPHARGWAVKLGTGADGSSTGRLILQKPRYVFWRLAGRHGDVTRGRETHRYDYTRPPAALSDELGGLSTSLGLFASPPLILSTESVVVMKWKGMSTSIATRAASPSGHASGDASRKRGIGTTRAHELGLRCYLDPCARG